MSKPAWAIDLHPVALHYYAGVVDNVDDLLEKHKVATQTSFGTRSSTKKQVAIREDKENCNSKVRMSIYKFHKIYLLLVITFI